MLVVSLSTIPPRFDMLGATLRSLLDQRQKIDVIRVNIPETYRRFPDHAFTRPALPEGVELHVGPVDFGPATKVLPALADYRDRTDVKIIFCDDDRIHAPDWAETLVATAGRNPGCAVAASGFHLQDLGITLADPHLPRAVQPRPKKDLAYRLARLRQQLREALGGPRTVKPSRQRVGGQEGFLDILEGCGGVLVRPEFFDARVFDVPEKLWSVDDIWLSGMLETRGIGIRSSFTTPVPVEQPGAGDSALVNAVIEGLDRLQANIGCVRYLQDSYGIWKEA